LFSLKQAEDDDSTTIWSQGWKSAQYLVLEGEREAKIEITLFIFGITKK
jgi:hypothetical protein